MPENFPALAVDTMPVHQTQPELLGNSPSGTKAGRLRQTFENDLVLGYLDLAEALAARFEARGRERASADDRSPLAART